MPSAACIMLLTAMHASLKPWSRLPNGNRPFDRDVFYTNPFWADFERAGSFWTIELCNADSDGDGQSNGLEMGDPCCEWLPGDTPAFTEDISLVGDAFCKTNRRMPKCSTPCSRVVHGYGTVAILSVTVFLAFLFRSFNTFRRWLLRLPISLTVLFSFLSRQWLLWATAIFSTVVARLRRLAPSLHSLQILFCRLLQNLASLLLNILLLPVIVLIQFMAHSRANRQLVFSLVAPQLWATGFIGKSLNQTACIHLNLLCCIHHYWRSQHLLLRSTVGDAMLLCTTLAKIGALFWISASTRAQTMLVMLLSPAMMLIFHDAAMTDGMCLAATFGYLVLPLIADGLNAAGLETKTLDGVVLMFSPLCFWSMTFMQSDVNELCAIARKLSFIARSPLASGFCTDAHPPPGSGSSVNNSATTNDQVICIVCLERERNIAFEPCGHCVCCRWCAIPMTRCPLCRAQVVRQLPIFLS
mmetsp:Transcript_15159/g.21460  ORF Transcript_15159/g.21460 Transcript_15159/m.21460 type:complete len:470 (-) Transcript_15159:82-1491(-)